MLKFLLIIFVAVWIFSKLIKYAFKSISWFAGDISRGQQNHHRSGKNGDIYVNVKKKKNKKFDSSRFHGGEYVDFEELKD